MSYRIDEWPKHYQGGYSVRASAIPPRSVPPSGHGSSDDLEDGPLLAVTSEVGTDVADHGDPRTNCDHCLVTTGDVHPPTGFLVRQQ